MPPRWSLRSVFGSKAGRLVLLGLAALTLALCFVYLGSIGQLLAIVDLLFFGLALPVYSGWKSPKHLAVYGLAAMLIAVPVASVLALQYAYVPSPAQDSPTVTGASAPILQGAVASPYAGAAGDTYVFSVTVNPQAVPTNASAPLWVELWVSTCPGATGPNDPFCGAGYPLLEQNRSLAGVNSSTLVSFALPINDSNIWTWTMGTAYYDTPGSTNLTWVFLDTFAVQGPIVGSYGDILLLALESFALSIFVGAGLVFGVGVAGYMWFKRREAARKSREAAGAPPPSPSGPDPGLGSPPGTAGAGPASPPGERSCPNCHAVVYPNEKQCWKCGAALSPPDHSNAPLPSK